MQMRPSQSDRIEFSLRGITNESPYSTNSSGLGDFLTDLTSALTAGAQAYTQVSTAELMAQSGIRPVGISNGVPIYPSTPAGVTPQYPYSLPSGMVLPAGVTQISQLPIGYVQQSTALPAYPTYQLPSLPADYSKYLPYLLLGGGALLVIALAAGR